MSIDFVWVGYMAGSRVTEVTNSIVSGSVCAGNEIWSGGQVDNIIVTTAATPNP